MMLNINDRVPETLPQETLNLFKALPKPDYPIATMQTLEDYDAFLFGIPTRFGTMPAQWKVRDVNHHTRV